MRIRDILFKDVVTPDQMPPCYDKAPGKTAFIIDNDGRGASAAAHLVRVFVPMIEGLDPDATTLALVKIAAEQGSTGIEWDGGFTPIQSHFNQHQLPFDVILRNPKSPSLVPPHGIRTIETPDVEIDRFYCLTTSEQFGRRPTRPGMISHGVRCPDTVGLFIFNPKGVLTVFLEPGQKRCMIGTQA